MIKGWQKDRKLIFDRISIGLGLPEEYIHKKTTQVFLLTGRLSEFQTLKNIITG